MTRLIDLNGRVFGRLRVTSRAENKPGKNARWNCECRCGGSKIVESYHLLNSHTTSCGCIKREQNLSMFVTHGMSKTPEYKIWQGIKKRCYDENSTKFPIYGGRGIRMSDEWLGSFEVFFADMGPRPSDRHSVERLDNNSGYSAANCVWATNADQSRNRRTNVNIEIDGVSMCLLDWSKKLDIPMTTIQKRLKTNPSYESALRPLDKKKSHRNRAATMTPAG